MKKLLFRVITRQGDKIEYKELIAATPADAGINALQNFPGVMDVINVPWHKMTPSQKIKITDAESEEHAKHLRGSVSLDDTLSKLEKAKNKILKNNSQISEFYREGIVL